MQAIKIHKKYSALFLYTKTEKFHMKYNLI